MKKRYIIIFVVQLFMFFIMSTYAVVQKTEADRQKALLINAIDRAEVSARQYNERIQALEKDCKNSGE